MGNGSSQSIVLGHQKLQSSSPVRNSYHYQLPKYVHPQNRVLPKPVVGQKLRSTDNGSILQTAGTIRGHKRDRLDEPEVRGAFGKRYELVENSNLRQHRLSHSDPDISRSRINGYSGDFAGHSRGGALLRGSKLKYKKKARAPDPPSTPKEQYRKKPKAPQPPPPPPPLPAKITTRTNVMTQQNNSDLSRSSSTTRAVECSRTTYEKHVHPLDKWRNYRSVGDVRIDEEEQQSGYGTTVFDSKKLVCDSGRPSHLPDPFQKEIQAVTKKIAQNRKLDGKEKTTSSQNKKDQVDPPPKQYYFSDANAFKTDKDQHKVDAPAQNKPRERTTLDEIVPSLQSSPTRRNVKSNKDSNKKGENEWENLSKNLLQNHDEESDIDIRLRPVLPRKMPEMAKFSPSEAWQALGSDGLASSNHSTSDDGREKFPTKSRVPIRTARNSYGNERRENHWTPRQDLVDDSDVSSVDSEEAVVPRMRPQPGEFSTLFSLPTVMFSNMRPIGSDIRSHKTKSDDAKIRKKVPKHVDISPENSSANNFRKFLSKKNRYMSEEDIAVSDSNWTFGQNGLQKRGKQYASDMILSDRKKYEVMKNSFGDFLGDILVTKSNQLRTQMKTSDSGNSNFSFYSTEGHIMYSPEKGGFLKEDGCPLPAKGRVSDIRRRFDTHLESPKKNFLAINGKRKPNINDIRKERKRDLELVRILEDEVRKRRNKEKINIRQQLQRMKHLHSDDEYDEFDDEAYFTEPKSREETQSPFFAPGPSRHRAVSEMALKQRLTNADNEAVTATDSAHLSHWQSSPALLEDSLMKSNFGPLNKEHLSSSSVMSSPDPEKWKKSNPDVCSWLQKQQNLRAEAAKNLASLERSSSDEYRFPEPRGNPETSTSQRKEKRTTTNIYKQLMDIVRREEKQLEKAQRENKEPVSRDSSYSQRESSHSASSGTSSSASSYTDTSSSRTHGKNGVSANKEFHASSYTNSATVQNDQKEEKHKIPLSIQAAFVQPYSPKKCYRPVPFDIVVSPSNGCRMSNFSERQQVQAEVS